MRKLWIVIAALIAVGAASNVNADATYNMVTGFSNTSNPNGVWTYEYNGTAFTDAQGISSALPGWYNGGTQPNSIVILQNVTGSAFVNLTVTDPTNTLYLDPQSGSVAVLFTAPSAGTYTIAGNFYGTDDSFNFAETLKAGDTISFDMGTGSGGSCFYCNLGTALSGTVTESSPTATPEPGTLGLMLAGIGALFAVMAARRKGQGLQRAV